MDAATGNVEINRVFAGVGVRLLNRRAQRAIASACGADAIARVRILAIAGDVHRECKWRRGRRWLDRVTNRAWQN